MLGVTGHRERLAPLRPLLIGVAVFVLTLSLIEGIRPPAVRAALSGPPSNPSANIPPNPDFTSACQSTSTVDNSASCIYTVVQAIDNARSMEGVGPVSLPTDYATMPAEEQLLVVVNVERVDRSLSPLQGTTTELDTDAQDGLAGADDPPVTEPSYGGAGWTGTSDYASDYSNALTALYTWMYDDGYSDTATPSPNTACTSSGARGCWAHRDSILGALGSEPNLTMGAAGGGSTWAIVLMGTVGAPSSYVYNWSTISSGTFAAPTPPSATTTTTTTTPSTPTTSAPSQPNNLSDCPPAVGADTPGKVTRVAGADRDATAIAISRQMFPGAGTAGAVVLASDANFPDSVVGGPLAVQKLGPLLVTPPSGLKPSVAAEIQRVLPQGDTVYILGGTLAVAASVDPELKADGFTVDRLQGPDRYATAVQVAGALGNPTTIVEASGLSYADALVAGSAAAALHGAVLLTNGTTQHPTTAAYLTAHPGSDVAVGAPAAEADPTARAVVGSDRYQTAVMVIQDFLDGPTTLGFAAGGEFPDALAGGTATAELGGGMLLIPACGDLSASVDNYLSSVSGTVTSGTLFGGDYAVDPHVLGEVNALLTPSG